MDTPTLISLIASIASLVLAVVAIALSIVFFRMSTDLSAQAQNAVKDIITTVAKIELLADKQYTGSFSVLTETYSDLRKQYLSSHPIGPDRATTEIEQRADEKTEALRREYQTRISELVDGQKAVGVELTRLKSEFGELVSKAINESRQTRVEAEQEIVGQRVLSALLFLKGQRVNATVSGIRKLMQDCPRDLLRDALNGLKEDGYITAYREGDDVRIELTEKAEPHDEPLR